MICNVYDPVNTDFILQRKSIHLYSICPYQCVIWFMNAENQFIDHTADIRLKINADSPDELFQSALSGMNEILKPGFCRKRLALTTSRSVHIKSQDTTTLLIDFLSEALTLSLLNKVIYCKLRIIKLLRDEITCLLEGCNVDILEEDIKAVTYHEADVRKNDKNEWETTIVFDI